MSYILETDSTKLDFDLGEFYTIPTDASTLDFDLNPIQIKENQTVFENIKGLSDLYVPKVIRKANVLENISSQDAPKPKIRSFVVVQESSSTSDKDFDEETLSKAINALINSNANIYENNSTLINLKSITNNISSISENKSVISKMLGKILEEFSVINYYDAKRVTRASVYDSFKISDIYEFPKSVGSINALIMIKTYLDGETSIKTIVDGKTFINKET